MSSFSTDWIQRGLGDTILGGSVRVFPEKFIQEGINAQQVMGWDSEFNINGQRHQHSHLSAPYCEGNVIGHLTILPPYCTPSLLKTEAKLNQSSLKLLL